MAETAFRSFIGYDHEFALKKKRNPTAARKLVELFLDRFTNAAQPYYAEIEIYESQDPETTELLERHYHHYDLPQAVYDDPPNYTLALVLDAQELWGRGARQDKCWRWIAGDMLGTEATEETLSYIDQFFQFLVDHKGGDQVHYTKGSYDDGKRPTQPPIEVNIRYGKFQLVNARTGKPLPYQEVEHYCAINKYADPSELTSACWVNHTDRKSKLDLMLSLPWQSHTSKAFRKYLQTLAAVFDLKLQPKKIVVYQPNKKGTGCNLQYPYRDWDYLSEAEKSWLEKNEDAVLDLLG